MGSQRLRVRPTAERLVGPLEYECLKVVWRHGVVRVGHVLKHLNGRRPDGEELAYTTVMTVLVRLHGKGILARTKRGRGYAYAATLTEDELVEHLSRQDIDDLLSRYGNVAVAQFALAMRDVSPQHIALLRELIASDEAVND